jgi:hypothetical protein
LARMKTLVPPNGRALEGLVHSCLRGSRVLFPP